MKSKAKSLFKADAIPAPPAIQNPTPDDVRAMLAAARSVDDLEAMLKQMETLADTAVADDQIERASEYAKRIREKARRVRLLVAEKKPDQVALEAMRLAEVWMQLRADTKFSGPVWEKEKRREAASAHSDEAILAAVAAHSKRIDAAVALNIDPSQLRKRLAAIKKRAS